MTNCHQTGKPIPEHQEPWMVPNGKTKVPMCELHGALGDLAEIIFDNIGHESEDARTLLDVFDRLMSGPCQPITETATIYVDGELKLDKGKAPFPPMPRPEPEPIPPPPPIPLIEVLADYDEDEDIRADLEQRAPWNAHDPFESDLPPAS